MMNKNSFTVHCLIFFAFIIRFTFSDALYSQTNWTKYPDNPVIVGEPYSPRERVLNPAVIYYKEEFKMYYTGFTMTLTPLRQIYYAESEDGIEWWVDPDPIITSSYPYGWDKHKFPCSVLDVDDTLRMWYWGSFDWWQYAIGYAWSINGEEWNVNPDPVMEKGDVTSWDSQYVMWPAVIYDSGMYHMWYSGSENWYDDYIFYASSMDGINWDKHPFPIIYNGPDGSYNDRYVEAGGVVKYNDTIHMYLMGWDGETYRIGYAWSTDYFNWEVSDTAIVDVGEYYEWDANNVGPATMLVHEGQLKMWYGGEKDLVFSIGYATGDSIWSPPTGVGEKINTEPYEMAISPNPSTGTFRLKYSIPETHVIPSGNEGRYSIFELYTVQGVKVRTLSDELQQAGEHEMRFDISDLPAGMYFVRMQIGKHVETVKLILMK